MSLSTQRSQRIPTLCALYFAQGVPWGFMLTTLVNYLSENGLSTEDAGVLTSVIILPWTFKLIWAPLLDTVTYRPMGRRRPWIIVAQLCMALTLLGILAVEPYMFGSDMDIAKSYTMLYWMFFIHNVFQSIQDVCTDALAVDILPESERGVTNGLMWGAKIVGKLVGTIVFAIVLDEYGLQQAIWLQFAILIGVMMFPIFLVERDGEKRMPWSKGEAQVDQLVPLFPSEKRLPSSKGEAQGGSDEISNSRSVVLVLKDLKQGFGLQSTVAFVVLIVVSLIGWGVMEVVLKTVCNQELGWNSRDTSTIMGLGVYPEAILALTAGWIGDHVGRRKMMTLGLLSYGGISIAFGMAHESWGTDVEIFGTMHYDWIVATYTVVYPALLAIFLVNFLAHAMQLSWTKSSATMFTIYMTLSNVGHAVGNYRAGEIEEIFGIHGAFIASGILTALSAILILLCGVKQVEEAKLKYSD